jgi:excisionase family DNA binding protein
MTENDQFGQHGRLLSLAEAADRLAISRRGLHRLLATGELSSIRVGLRRRVIDPAELARFVDTHREPPSS